MIMKYITITIIISHHNVNNVDDYNIDDINKDNYHDKYHNMNAEDYVVDNNDEYIQRHVCFANVNIFKWFHL